MNNTTDMWEIKKDPLDSKGRYKLYVNNRIVNNKVFWKLIGGSPARYHGITYDPAVLCYVVKFDNKIIMHTDDGETILHVFKA